MNAVPSRPVPPPIRPSCLAVRDVYKNDPRLLGDPVPFPCNRPIHPWRQPLPFIDRLKKAAARLVGADY